MKLLKGTRSRNGLTVLQSAIHQPTRPTEGHYDEIRVHGRDPTVAMMVSGGHVSEPPSLQFQEESVAIVMKEEGEMTAHDVVGTALSSESLHAVTKTNSCGSANVSCHSEPPQTPVTSSFDTNTHCTSSNRQEFQQEPSSSTASSHSFPITSSPSYSPNSPSVLNSSKRLFVTCSGSETPVRPHSMPGRPSGFGASGSGRRMLEEASTTPSLTKKGIYWYLQKSCDTLEVLSAKSMYSCQSMHSYPCLLSKFVQGV